MNRRRRRRAARVRLAALVGPPGLVGAVYLAGLILPVTHVVRTELQVRATPEHVWAVLTDLEAMPTWRAGLAAVERLPAERGLIRWREIGATGSRVALERVEATPATRLVVRVAEPNIARRCVYQLEPLGGTTRVLLSYERAVPNPFVRTGAILLRVGRAGLLQHSRELAARVQGRHQQIARSEERR